MMEKSGMAKWEFAALRFLSIAGQLRGVRAGRTTVVGESENFFYRVGKADGFPIWMRSHQVELIDDRPHRAEMQSISCLR